MLSAFHITISELASSSYTSELGPSRRKRNPDPVTIGDRRLQEGMTTVTSGSGPFVDSRIELGNASGFAGRTSWLQERKQNDAHAYAPRRAGNRFRDRGVNRMPSGLAVSRSWGLAPERRAPGQEPRLALRLLAHGRRIVLFVPARKARRNVDRSRRRGRPVFRPAGQHLRS